MFSGKNVLLTGGGGSVGRELSRRLLQSDLRVLRILDNNEPNLSRLRSALDDDRCRYLAGDIRDKDRLERAIEDIDIVVHTAAMKHVDVCEYNPFEAVKTNVIGMQNVIDAAIDSTVDRVVFTSSDKAVNPANTMGSTKLLGEKLITAGNKHAGRSDLCLTSVRFGNVVNSSGSVIPHFREQIRTGGPVTLTDRRMCRFFLTFDGVFDLVTDAIEHTKGGEIFVKKMPAIRIEDLAHVLIDEVAPAFGHDPDDIGVKVTGRRLGETFDEEIVTDREGRRTVESESLYAILPEVNEGSGYLDHDGLDGFADAENVVQSTAAAEPLTRDEIVSFLDGTGALEVAE